MAVKVVSPAASSRGNVVRFSASLKKRESMVRKQGSGTGDEERGGRTGREAIEWDE